MREGGNSECEGERGESEEGYEGRRVGTGAPGDAQRSAVDLRQAYDDLVQYRCERYGRWRASIMNVVGSREIEFLHRSYRPEKWYRSWRPRDACC